MVKYTTLENWSKGRKRKLSDSARKIKIFSTWIISLVVILAIFIFPDSLIYRPAVFSLYFALVFLMYAPTQSSHDKPSWVDIVLIILTLGVGVYYILNGSELMARRPYIHPLKIEHQFVALLATLILNEGVRRVVGSWIVGINLVFVLYALFGHLIPGRFGVKGLNLELMLDGLYFTRTGVWGVTVAVAFSSLIMIILFSSFVLASGLDQVILKMFQKWSFKGSGGSGMLAVIASAFFGMISGGGTSNVTTTGTLTIPLMKKQGYSPIMAAAIESSASMASTFTPPIMGSVAFLMAELLGLPYGRVMVMATIPALLYYGSLLVLVKSYAITHHIDQLEKTSSIGFPLKSLWLFLPMIYFIIAATMQQSITRSALEAIVLTIGLHFILNLKVDLKFIVSTIEKGIDRTIPIVISMAGAGLFIGIINLTGFATKLSVFFRTIQAWPIAIIIVMVALMVIFLGLALNTISTYLIAVVLFAPTLVRFGFDLNAVHMFIVIFAALGSITPPVALTSLTAATIAQAPIDAVGWKAMTLSIPAYVIGVLLLFQPQLMSPSLSLDFVLLALNSLTLSALWIVLIVLGKPSLKVIYFQLAILVLIECLWFGLSFWWGSIISAFAWLIIPQWIRKKVTL
ncbi:MAG: TRAP transporter fused permease subunit [Erysipelotrichia bacterium]|jgi:TRAP transporter 4TM/12TM fusion protein|nr:TRAP transporter fused permease subunit [Erysipelotrichia bacterium]